MRFELARSLAAALALAGSAHASDTIEPPAALLLEGVPPVPAALAAEVARYTESRAATFANWHPTKTEMLISTRFADTAQLHHVAMAGGARRQLTFFAEPVRSGSFDPVAGSFIIYARDTGGGEFAQLHRLDLADGRTTLLTDGGRSQNQLPVWSPDGRSFAYASTRRNGTDRDIHVMSPGDPGSNRLVMENAGGGWSVSDWSPDGSTLLVLEYVSINEAHLWLVDVASGTRSELTPRSQKGISRSSARFSRDGRGVYLTTDENYEFKRLAFLDLATRQTEFLTTGMDHDIDGLSLSDDGRKLIFTAKMAGATSVYLIDLAIRRATRVEGFPTAVITSGTWHKDSRHVAFVVNSARSASDVHVLDVEAGSLTPWTESELGGIQAGELRDAELVRWPSFDGLEISGFLYRPAARFTGPRPVIISIHGGPESQALPVFRGRSNYYLNELGVAMIFPNVRGSAGFGKTFVALDNGQRREDSVRDIGALLDWIEQQPDLDRDRIMVTGGSYGGYMALACAVHYNDRIRCTVDVVGISNFVTFLENTESYRRDLRRAEYGDERDPEMRAFLESASPLNHAARILKPVFIVQGANDPRVPRTEAVQMVRTIREHGGSVWYMEAANEGHGFAKKANADYQFFSTIQFVRRHLLE